MILLLYNIFICKMVQEYCFDIEKLTSYSAVCQHIRGIFFLNYDFYDNHKRYIYSLFCIIVQFASILPNKPLSNFNLIHPSLELSEQQEQLMWKLFINAH